MFVQELERVTDDTISEDTPLDSTVIGVSCTLIKMYQTAIEVYFRKKDRKNFQNYKQKLHNFLRRPHMQKIAYK